MRSPTLSLATLVAGMLLALPVATAASPHKAAPAGRPSSSSAPHRAAPASAPSRAPPPAFGQAFHPAPSRVVIDNTSPVVVHTAPAAVAAAPAAPAPQPSSFGLLLGGEGYLLRDKVAVGITLGGEGRWFGMSFGFAPSYITEDDPNRLVPGRSLGAIWSIHAHVPFRIDRLEIRPGLGLDIFDLWNRLGSELGMPLLVDVRYNLVGRFGPFVQGRYYLLRSSGLEVNTDREGRGGPALLFTTGLEVTL